MALDSMQEIFDAADVGGREFWEVVLDTDMEERSVTAEASMEKMRIAWRAMLEAVDTYRGDRLSASGLVGGDGKKMRNYAAEMNTLSGPYLAAVIASALCTGESNACMRRIVAAPTAGASGVLPAVLLPYRQRRGLEDGSMVEALYVAAGFGQVIAARASISGAEGGCQAEVGSASAMAAAALVHLEGGSPAQMADACALALSGLMGLVCDPVAGLVEVPCITRNVTGAVNAMACAELALSGVRSAIPWDEVIDAMRAVGDALPSALRETGQGGLAATPTGRKIAATLGDKPQ